MVCLKRQLKFLFRRVLDQHITAHTCYQGNTLVYVAYAMLHICVEVRAVPH